jgi:hypothetical protein
VHGKDEQKRTSSTIDAELKFTNGQLDAREVRIEMQSNEAKERRRKVQEAERKLRMLPDVEQQYRTILEQPKGN